MSDERPLTREERLLAGQVAAGTWVQDEARFINLGLGKEEIAEWRQDCWEAAEAFVRARPEHLDPSKAPVDADLYVTEREVAEAAEGIEVKGTSDGLPFGDCSAAERAHHQFDRELQKDADAFVERQRSLDKAARSCADAAAAWARAIAQPTTATAVAEAQSRLLHEARHWMKLTEKTP